MDQRNELFEVNKRKLRLYRDDVSDIISVRAILMERMLAEDDYTIRLWNAEAKLEDIGYVRGRDGRWRKKVTAAEVAEMEELRGLASDKLW